MRLASIRRNQTNNAGTLVRNLIASAGGDRIRDVDAGALEGIAVIGTNRLRPLGVLAGQRPDMAAFRCADVLAAVLAPTGRRRPVRPGPLHGTVGDGLTFRAWDRSAAATAAR
jgi:hypothetical protein